jgi:hypothetical protein
MLAAVARAGTTDQQQGCRNVRGAGAGEIEVGMRDLVLRTRMDSLQTHLEEIQDFLASVRNRQAEFQELQKILTASEDSVKSSVWVLHDVIEKSVLELRLTNKSAASELPKAQPEVEKLINLIDQLARARTILISMRTFSSQIEGLGIGQALKGILKNRAAGCTQTLSDLQNELKAGADAKDAWKEFGDKLDSRTLPLFAEYVEFVGGLALRDAGFDAGICQIADELIQSYEISPGARTDLLTIPVQQQAVALTLERIIHLNFPEWTIWALPLTAHEFWHIVACKNEKICRLLQKEIPGQVTAKLDVYLADAFATYAMGLAYAYSAILLRFNPRPQRSGESALKKNENVFTRNEGESDSHDKQADWVFERLKSLNDEAAGKPWTSLISQLEQDWEAKLKLNEKEKNGESDAKRAFCVFAMLKWMNKRDSARPWTGLIDELEQEWEAALKQVNPAPLALDHAFKEQMNNLIDGLGTMLHRETCFNFPVVNWGNIVGWVDKLLDNKVSEIQLQGTEELRHVLNAAWLARLQNPTKTKNIDEAAQYLRKRISDDKSRRDKGVTAAGAPWRPGGV